MSLTATIRDESGRVLCAYILKPMGGGTHRMAGHDALELAGVRYLVNTVLEPDPAAARESLATEQDIMECGHCGGAMPFKGLGVWSTCPLCGTRQKRDIPASRAKPDAADTDDGELPLDLDELPF